MKATEVQCMMCMMLLQYLHAIKAHIISTTDAAADRPRLCHGGVG